MNIAEVLVGPIVSLIITLVGVAVSWGKLKQKVDTMKEDHDKEFADLKNRVDQSNDYKQEISITLVKVSQQVESLNSLVSIQIDNINETMKTLSKECRDLTEKTSHMAGRLDRRQ